MSTGKFAKRVAQLKPSSTLALTAKAKEMKTRGISVISFGAGEPDFDTPLNIKETAIEAINKGFTKYTPASGTAELKNAVCEKLKKDNGLFYPPEQVVISCGAKHALYNIFQVLCEKGDEVVLISPYWLSYPEMIRLAEAEPVIVKASEENEYVPGLDAIKRAITPKTKVILLNSPSNPTGAVLDEQILREIGRVAVSKGIYVISDEIYEKLIYNGIKHTSIGALGKDIFSLTLTVNGVSKSYSMTGWRIGYVAGPGAVMKEIAAFQSHSTSNPTSISQAAALEALQGEQSFVAMMRDEFEKRRDYMVKRINAFRKMSCVEPKGAFYIFCNISKTGLNSVEISQKLLEEAHVACVPGDAFGSDAHIRLSFASSMESIKEGLDRIEKWLG